MNARREYDNTNKGALFTAKEKKSDKSPDSTGQINVEGREYWISAWRKKDRNGQGYLSLAVQPKDKGQQSRGGTKAAPAPKSEAPELDDDIPF